MLIAAHQPNFLPNLGFFYKMAKADFFVVISNIQFEKQEGWQQRHKIPGPNNDIWLTVPVFGSQSQKIKEVRINNLINWRGKHKKTIELIYSKTGEEEILKELLKIYDEPWERLVDLNFAIISYLKEALAIKTQVILDEEVFGEKHDLLISICKKYKADEYLSGSGAKHYMDEKYFSEIEKNSISHFFVDKNLSALYPYSAIHYLLKNGKEEVLKLIKT